MNKKPGSSKRPRVKRKAKDDERTRQPAREATPGRDTTREAKTVAGGTLAKQVPDAESAADASLDSFDAVKRVPPADVRPL